jgi:hypothetical protein
VKVIHTVTAAALAVVTLTASALVQSAEVAPTAASQTVVVDSVPVVHPRLVAPQPRPHVVSKPRVPRVTQPSRSTHRTPRKPVAASAFGRCVIRHESLTAGLYRAQNPVSTASGAYQFTNGTWRAYQLRAGFGSRYARAKDAPPRVQDAVFSYAISQGDYYHWKGTHCGHGT